MSQQQRFPGWLIKMLQSGLNMRDAQKDYFAQPNDYKRKVAIAKEREFDQLLDHFVKTGDISHIEKQPTNQITLPL